MDVRRQTAEFECKSAWHSVEQLPEGMVGQIKAQWLLPFGKRRDDAVRGRATEVQFHMYIRKRQALTSLENLHRYLPWRANHAVQR